MADFDFLVGMAFGALGSLLLWVTVGRKMMLAYGGKSVMRAIIRMDDDTKEALRVLLGQAWIWFVTPSIKTGKDIEEKDEKGEVISRRAEILSPFQNMVQEIGRYVRMNIGSMLGGKQKKVNELLGQIDAIPDSGAGSSNLKSILAMAMQGRKGLDLEGLLTALIVNFIGKKDTGGGGGGGWRPE